MPYRKGLCTNPLAVIGGKWDYGQSEIDEAFFDTE